MVVIIDVPEGAPNTQVTNAEKRFLSRGLFIAEMCRLDLMAGHEAGQAVRVESARLIVRDHPPVPQYRDGVGDLQDLVQLVRDEEGGDPLKTLQKHYKRGFCLNLSRKSINYHCFI